MYYMRMETTRLYLVTNDGRYVTQHGFTPTLTTNLNLRYSWSVISEEMKKAYETALNVVLNIEQK